MSRTAPSRSRPSIIRTRPTIPISLPPNWRPDRYSTKLPNTVSGHLHDGWAVKAFETPELMQLFPTFVWKGDLKPQDCEPLNRDIVAALAGMGAPLEGLRPGENWQSDHRL